MSFLQQCFGTNWQSGLLMAVLIVMLPLAAVFMYRLQRDTNNLNFADWFRGPDGKASWKEVQGIGAFFVGSWAFVHGVATGKFPEGFSYVLLIYLAVCGGIPTAMSIINRVYPANGPAIPPPNQQIKVDAPADATVSVQTGGDKP